MKKKYYLCIVFRKRTFIFHHQDYVCKGCKSGAKILKKNQICNTMADFYVNFGSNNAKLVGYYKLNNVNLKLHQVKCDLYIISKNRKIIYKCFDPGDAMKAFHNAIYLEAGTDLFINN